MPDSPYGMGNDYKPGVERKQSLRNDSSNTTPKQQGGVTGKGFVKGDPRINRKGRPKSFDALRELAQQIAHEVVSKDGQPIIIEGHRVTVAEAILREWARSGKPQLQQGFIEIAFGKVPTPIEVRDWREAARQRGLNPDEVVREFESIVAAHVGDESGDSGSAGADTDDGGEEMAGAMAQPRDGQDLPTAP